MNTVYYFVIVKGSIVAVVTNYEEGDRLRKANAGSVLAYCPNGKIAPSAQRAKNWVKDGYDKRFANLV